MKKSSTDKTLDTFEEWMHLYIEFLAKVVRAKQVVKHPFEKREVIEAFVLRIAAVWEILAEELMIDCLNRDSSQLGKHLDLTLDKDLPRPVCRAIVAGLNYFDFKSTGDLKKKAKRILAPSHNPFKAISKGNGQRIDEFFALRNYLAHYSQQSRRSVKRLYTENHGLTRFREPGTSSMHRRDITVRSG